LFICVLGAGRQAEVLWLQENTFSLNRAVSVCEGQAPYVKVTRTRPAQQARESELHALHAEVEKWQAEMLRKDDVIHALEAKVTALGTQREAAQACLWQNMC
jgi:hypothetical protein